MSDEKIEGWVGDGEKDSDSLSKQLCVDQPFYVSSLQHCAASADPETNSPTTSL